MSVSRYLTQALIDCWNQASVDSRFTDFWPSAKNSALYSVLSDTEASPGQPFPYVVFEQGTTLVETRTSSNTTSKFNRIQRTSVTFTVHTNASTSLGGKSAKERAADLAEVVMYVYGDTPTVDQRILDFEVGAHILTQYQNDFPVRTGDEEFSWVVNYDFVYNIPVVLWEENSSSNSSLSSSSNSSSSSSSSSSSVSSSQSISDVSSSSSDSSSASVSVV